MLLKNIVSTFKKHQEWHDLTPQKFAQLEILLYLSLQIEDTYPANDLYMLLGSRNLIVKNDTFNLSDFMLSNAKRNLKTLNQSKVFRDILRLYVQDRFKQIRFYNIEDNQVKRADIIPGFYNNREKDYSKLLSTDLKKQKKTITFAKNFNEHEYCYIAEGNRAIKINFPKDVRTITLNSCITKHKRPLSVDIKDILDTASNIDVILGNSYRQKILSNSKLLEISENNLKQVQNIEINGVIHMIGQVGAGKSTIAESLTVVLASRGARIVIIEATVQESIAKAKLLSKLGVKAVSIVGKSGRLSHINAAIKEQDFLDEYYSKVLTPGCLIGALSNKSDEIIQYGNEPCHRLKRFKDNTTKPTNYVCPFYYQCPKTDIDKQFIDANVIITTLEGLCSISMLAERELIFNHILDHTDLVIID
ncbi:MAG: hypothetical protein ACRCSG_04810, partial [Cellulosilyticaceae bacterium]